MPYGLMTYTCSFWCPGVELLVMLKVDKRGWVLTWLGHRKGRILIEQPYQLQTGD